MHWINKGVLVRQSATKQQQGPAGMINRHNQIVCMWNTSSRATSTATLTARAAGRVDGRTASHTTQQPAGALSPEDHVTKRLAAPAQLPTEQAHRK
jgi:hypothetical protein